MLNHGIQFPDGSSGGPIHFFPITEARVQFAAANSSIIFDSNPPHVEVIANLSHHSAVGDYIYYHNNGNHRSATIKYNKYNK